jgi:hypothetical protein
VADGEAAIWAQLLFLLGVRQRLSGRPELHDYS